MKKIIFLCILFFCYQNWDKISSKISGNKPNQELVSKGTTLYATKSCGYCQKVRELFAEKNVSYTEVDIESSSEARDKFNSFNKSGVPLLVINNKIIHGYNEQAILNEISQTNKL